MNTISAKLHDSRDFNNQNAAAIGLALLFKKQNRAKLCCIMHFMAMP